MTLLELMLVLALMVIIGAMTLPALRGPFANHRLRKAGELVRVYCCKARLRAMKTGQIQMLRYVVGEKTFRIEPYVTEQDWLEADAAHARQSQPGMMAAPAVDGTQEPTLVRQHELPDGVLFAGGGTDSDSRSMRIEQQTRGSLTMESQGVPPILFYPDSTTSDSRVVLVNDQQMYVRISLRGLTGLATVGPLLNTDEMQQLQQAEQTRQTQTNP